MRRVTGTRSRPPAAYNGRPHVTTDESLRLHTLGPVAVRRAGDPPTSSCLSQPRLVGLLCYLALARPRGLHARDTLVALFWPDYDEHRARKALRNALHSLRSQLGRDVILSAGDQLVGLDATRITCDALELEHGNWRDDASFLERDVEPLQGFHVRGAASFEHWLSNERERLRTLLKRRVRDSAQSSIATTIPRAQVHDAWIMHARGHYLFLRTAHGGPADELLRSRDYFERALAIDSTFAPALAGLSNFYAVAARRGVLKPFHEHFAHAIQLSEQTLALDATIAIPHVHFGVKALFLDDDFERAEQEFRTAIAKDPTYGEGHRFLGVVLGLTRCYDEALRAMEHSVALEPDIAHFISSLASARLAVGDKSGAEEALRRVLLLEPRHGPARDRLLSLLERDGRLHDAAAERERHPALPDAAAFRAAAVESDEAYRHLAQLSTARELDVLLPRVMNPDPTRVEDIFLPPVIRVVQLYARLGDWKRVRSWRLQAQAERPALSRWFEALPELQAEAKSTASARE